MSPSKYQPLADWLAAQETPAVTLTFADVARILGSLLPAGARWQAGWWTPEVYQSWWTRGEHSDIHARLWRAAGWHVTAVDLETRRVTFTRLTEAPPQPREAATQQGDQAAAQ
jgi:hypothetical protein